ncbi:PPE domain-containing protein [Rhodococcus sp. NPDC003348]
MTLGFTGVVWFPRGATWNSTALNAGIGPAGFAAAGTAWSAVATGLTDATATVTKVMTELRVGWEGVASDAALAKLAPFLTWTEQAAAVATATAAKAGVEAAAHTIARATMPSLAEIAAVKAATVAAHTVGGSLAGAGAAAEAADKAMDLRAALVMEAYESASSIVSVQQGFSPPPPLANAGGAAPPDAPVAPVPQNTLLSDFAVNPAQAAQAALGTVLAQAQSPTVVAAASQVGAIAGTGVSTVAGAASALAPAAAAIGGSRFGDAGAPTVTGAAPEARAGGSARTVGAAGYSGGPGRGGPAGAPRITLPEGWGGATGTGGSGIAGRGAAMGAVPGLEPAPVARVEAAAAARPGHLGAPLGAGASQGAEDEEHRTPGYLKSFEHFEDGRVVIPSVIGGDR